MNLYRSKCNTCGMMAYVFPDQVEAIKKNDRLALYKYVKGVRLRVGSPWLCIKCDASNKNGKDCSIYAELTGEDAAKKIKIRKRETNLRGMGFSLPQSI